MRPAQLLPAILVYLTCHSAVWSQSLVTEGDIETAGTFSGDGSGLTGVDADELAGLAASAYATTSQLDAAVNGLESMIVAARAAVVFLSSDQTIGAGGNFIGPNIQSSTFDDVAQVAPEAGRFTQLTFSIRQNIGQGGIPIGPGLAESVTAYLVIVPFDSLDLDYGTPRVTVVSLGNFLDGGEIDDGTHVPLGTRLVLATVLDETTGHNARTSIADLETAPQLSAGDLFAVWLRPNGFTSFQPAVGLTLVLAE